MPTFELKVFKVGEEVVPVVVEHTTDPTGSYWPADEKGVAQLRQAVALLSDNQLIEEAPKQAQSYVAIKQGRGGRNRTPTQRVALAYNDVLTVSQFPRIIHPSRWPMAIKEEWVAKMAEIEAERAKGLLEAGKEEAGEPAADEVA